MEPARTAELAVAHAVASGSLAPGAILDDLPPGIADLIGAEVSGSLWCGR